jgi:uncharacterized membrane protein
MYFFFVLLLLLGGAVLVLLLPVVTFLRTLRLTSELQALTSRLASLEATLRPPSVDVGIASPASMPHDLPKADARDMRPPPSMAADAISPLERAAPPLPVEAAPPSVRLPEEGGGLEAAIGGRWLLYAGIVAFVLGIGFFVKYAFDHEWITEGMRVGLGALCGFALIGSGLRLARAGYDTYGNMLVGGGIAALYLSTYASFDFYGLIGRGTASTLFIILTAGAGALADRQRHQGLAVMAVGGGFLTPFLVGGTTDSQIVLFSYVALLVAATTVLAVRRDWPLLNVVSYGLTILTVAAWADVHYRPHKYLRTQAFLTLYCLMFLAMLRESGRGSSPLRDVARLVLGSAPVLFHFASIAVLRRHDVALLVYLILFALAGVAWSARTDRAWLRLLVWIAAMVPLFGWLEVHQSSRWAMPSLATLGALFALPLAAQIDRVVRRAGRLTGTDLFLLHLNALGTLAAVWVVLDDVAIWWVPRIGLLLAGVHAAIARWLLPREEHAAPHALAAAFTLLAAAIGMELDSRWLTAAWAAEGAAVMWVGLRVRKDWFRAGGALLLATAAARWAALSAFETPSDFELIVNEAFALGAWIIGLIYGLAWCHRRAAGATNSYGTSTAILLVAASVLTVVLLSTQNAFYWDVRSETMADARFAEQLALSLLWAFYAGVLIAVGIRRGYAPIRHAAIALIGFTVLKVFVVDLSGLEGIYRVLGLLVVGAVLLAVSFLYQRGRQTTTADAGAADAQEPPAPAQPPV